MHIFKLRFSGEHKNFEFDANLYRLARDINQGFIDYKSATGNTSGSIELFYPIRGWDQMFIVDCYPIVTNPMTLDFDAIAYGLIDSLSKVSQRPNPKTEKDKLREVRRESAQLTLIKT